MKNLIFLKQLTRFQVISRINLRPSSHFTKSLLLESTRLQYEQSIRDGTQFIQQLISERKHLSESLTNSSLKNHETFTRLDYLKRVESLNTDLANLENDLAELEKIVSGGDDDDEMRKLAQNDSANLSQTLLDKKIELIDLLLPEESEDKESAMLELSAGVGGLESRIFCGELFEMYRVYAENQGWKFNCRHVFTDNTELGEMMRQAHVEVEGARVFEYFKFESGVHRVQRVPKTDAKGRIHTSTVGVVVVPKPEEIRIELNPKDLKIELKTSGGPGGQHANKTHSAVRIVHLPTG